ncbi:pyruvate:ferredoxin (flavodoxin) oxidoreductase [bacterium]|nr:pyruvate:ferredoxin (flavodoxin) oxidoreductase [bacterium]
MEPRRVLTIDANEAVAMVAHRLAEVIAIYPITPATPMGEYADEWTARHRTNLWGVPPKIVEMQSEGGAAGAVHGALQAGALATTFTASQGLLLMIPNMYKIAGELTAFCMHVAARTLATHALSIFGDHSDVMACRQTGFALLASANVQEAHDMAAIAHAATLQSRVPFLHFFDGFRTSHEIGKIEVVDDATLRALIPDTAILAHRERALSPDRPVIRGTAQNPDTFFQAREAANRFHDACPATVRETMARFHELTGRSYGLFEYEGHPEAERVVVIMGSGADTACETAAHLAKRGERVGVVKVRLYRPFAIDAFVAALPASVKSIAVLDRTKEPGAVGEPLYLDVVAALGEALDDGAAPFDSMPAVIGGRYGLSSREFTPAMVKGVFDHLAESSRKRHFTVGIVDDITHHSIPYDPAFSIEPDSVVRAVFFGLGSDGTVGSNKNTIKIIGEETDNFGQGYFVYDSKKSGAMTISHLRFGPEPIRAPYLIREAGFVACHHAPFLDRIDVLACAKPEGVFLLNTPTPIDDLWESLPTKVRRAIKEKNLRVFAIDAYAVAGKANLGRHISTVMQTCFFALSGVLPMDEAIEKIKGAIKKTFGKRGDEIVRRNEAAVDAALGHLRELPIPDAIGPAREPAPTVPREAPEFVQRVTAVILEGRGDELPVSAFPVDGTWPTGTTQWEKRAIALEIPIWDPDVCIQCAKCAMVCPHATIRANLVEPSVLDGAPGEFRVKDNRFIKGFDGWKYIIQVAPDDCTGCGLCVAVCPAKDKSNPRHKAIDMRPVGEHRERERANWAYFTTLPEPPREKLPLDIKGSQLREPLFEFSGACAGCGETPYIKLLTQLFGDRLLIANATGCTSIYGGNLPTTPYRANGQGRGPAWSNSLFEDNAEFGLGFRLAVDAQQRLAAELLSRLSTVIDDNLADAIMNAAQDDEAGIAAQRERVRMLRERLANTSNPVARRLDAVAESFVRKSVWIVGGDGWAYDIGYGGLDHILSLPHDVNVLVLDTEVYSNTGGQMSKATPIGAAAKFAAKGKTTPKKDLGMLAMSYGHVYVAHVAFGARDAQTVRAFVEAEAHRGPSLIIAYAHCIAHGYDLSQGAEHQRLAVQSGVWPLFRFDPHRMSRGEPPLVLDSPAPTVRVADYMRREGRFRMVELADPRRYQQLLESAERETNARFAIYQQLAGVRVPAPNGSNKGGA